MIQESPLLSTRADHSPWSEESQPSTLVRCSSPPHDGGFLIEELQLEIISLVPARERWRCKQVCKHWLRLAKMLPQSLAGFFYTTVCKERLPKLALHFFNVSGKLEAWRPRPLYFDFDFLPVHRRIDLLDSRNGLLLCRLWVAYPQAEVHKFVYAVCNPATQEWVTLPDRSKSASNVLYAHLGFDPATSSHFHVFLLLEGDILYISGVDLYSSETRSWVRREQGWDYDVQIAHGRKETVFLNGYLHFHAYLVGHEGGSVPCIAVVANDGETWTTISVPTFTADDDSFIQLSRGCLHYACFERDEYDDEDYEADDELAIYVLKDYDSKQWKLKHRCSTTDLLRQLEDREELGDDFDWIAIHPECNIIFFAAGDPKQYMCYNMDTHKTKVMCTLPEGQPPYLPYVPLYTELQSLRM